jgi:putative bacteriocin precursor
VFNVKKLNKDYTSMDNTVESYANYDSICGDCTCTCGNNDAAMYGTAYGVSYSSHVIFGSHNVK